MDKTRFKIGFGLAQWVIANDVSKTLVKIDANNQEYITLTKLISGVGRTIPAFLILQDKYILHK